MNILAFQTSLKKGKSGHGSAYLPMDSCESEVNQDYIERPSQKIRKEKEDKVQKQI